MLSKYKKFDDNAIAKFCYCVTQIADVESHSEGFNNNIDLERISRSIIMLLLKYLCIQS